MLTRRSFFGTVAALVVGGGVAQLRLTAEPGTWASIERSTFPAWRAHVPASTGALTPEVFQRLFNACRRDDGDTILELR